MMFDPPSRIREFLRHFEKTGLTSPVF